MRRQLLAADPRCSSSLTVLCGIVYPLVVTGISQVAFPTRPNGSLVEARRRRRGLDADRPELHRRREYFQPAPVGCRRRLRRDCRARAPTSARRTPMLLDDGRASGSPPTGRRTGSRRRARCPSTPSRRPARGSTRTSRGQRPASRPPASRAPAALAAGEGARARSTSTPTAAPRLPRRAGCERAGAQPRPRRRAVRSRFGHGPRARCGSTSAPRPASARPSPCSTRAAGAATAAPTSWSASSRPTARPTTAAQIGDLEVVPAASDRVPRRRRSRRWTSTPSSPARPQVALVDELAHTNVPGSPQREAVAGRRRAARRRHRRDLDASTSSTSSRSTTSSSGSPGSSSARRSPTRSCGAPTRSSSST